MSVQSVCLHVSPPLLCSLLSSTGLHWQSALPPVLSYQHTSFPSSYHPHFKKNLPAGVCCILPSPASHLLSFPQDFSAILPSRHQLFFLDISPIISPELHHPQLISTTSNCVIEFFIYLAHLPVPLSTFGYCQFLDKFVHYCNLWCRASYYFRGIMFCHKFLD